MPHEQQVLSEALVDEIRRELDALALNTYQVVVSHGRASNYSTTYGNLYNKLYGGLGRSIDTPLQPAPFAFFNLPRMEGAGVQWRAILLGHEVAHVAVHERNSVDEFGLEDRFDFASAEALRNPFIADPSAHATAAFGLYRIAQNWTTELLCDAYALHRFGPAAVSGLSEYLLSTGSGDKPTSSHPPLILRLKLLLHQLGSVDDQRLRRVVTPWIDYARDYSEADPAWAGYLARLFLDARDDLVHTVARFGSRNYKFGERATAIIQLAERLNSGIPGREIIAEVKPDWQHRRVYAAVDADVVNAVWLARVEGSDLPFDSLGRKALESLEFVRRWVGHGGQLPFDLYLPFRSPPSLDDEADRACLSEELLTQRLRLDDERALRVTPLVHRPSGAGLDLRLGNRFIVFRRTGTATFDPLGAEDDPRSIQFHLELSWNEHFVLHPQEVVLGASLEYLSMPQDLTGQVITRSSYGRLGLLSATAVQIHPGFSGCLTLELVNLSTIPITLTPGERLAQLVVWRTAQIEKREGKYSYPIGPQFSRVREDAEAGVLRSMYNP